MSDATIEKLAFLALGWLLGLLGPVIVDSIKRRRENNLGRAAILNELTELAGILSTAAYGARMHLGTTDRKFLEWLKITLEQYATTPKLQEFIPRIRTQLTWTDDQLRAVVEQMTATDGKGTVLQHYPVPLLDARVSALWSFETSFQRQLLEIRRNVAILDDVVDRSRKYFDMTFTKLEGNNFQLVTENLTQTYELYAERAVTIVDQIKSLKIGPD
ncbi:hypothetical protein [Rhodoferax sp. WC2427]|uniref:hypothetical protein n=1 Tax=Rhodoferax sp. WC2427 TaxID=3234144 RepID=UPI003465D463